MGEQEDLPPIDGCPPGDDAVAQVLFFAQAERGGPVDRKPVQFDEGIGVDEGLHALTGRAFAALVLLFDRLGAGGSLRQVALAL